MFFKKNIFIMFMLIIIISTYSVDMSVNDILKKIEFNQNPDSISYNGKMLIHRKGRTIEKKFDIWSVGNRKAFIEFNYPPRDRGTKYLRLDDNLWMYIPNAEKTVKISGHMLKQSIMGSDFSYDDQTENGKISENYSGFILSQDKLDSFECVIIDISANETSTPNYYRQKIWVDKYNFTIIKAELYGRSGKLLKIMSCRDFRKINGRHYSLYTKMEDAIKNDYYTEIIIENIRLDEDISENIFTLRNLEKK